MNVRLAPRFALRLEYERAFDVGDKVIGEGDVSAAFVGVSYRF
jgi:hypothetical protein